MLLFYLLIGLAQGLVLWWVLLKSELSGQTVAVVTAVMVGGLLLQLLGKCAWSGVAIFQSLLTTLVLSALTTVVVYQWGVGFAWIYEGSAGIVLLTIFSAALIRDRTFTGFKRHCLTGAVIVALALPLPWLAQIASHYWDTWQHTDPFKNDVSALLYFVRPTGLFAVGMYYANVCTERFHCRSELARDQPPG